MLNSINKTIKKTLVISLSLAAILPMAVTLPSLPVKSSAIPIRQDQVIDANGVIVRNRWFRHPIDNGVWCYVGNDGVMVKNQWVLHPNNNGTLCYVGNDGIMVRNQVIRYNGVLYRLGSDGRILGIVHNNIT